MNPKKIITSLATAFIAICFTENSLQASTFGKFTYKDNGTSVTITGYPTSATGTVSIPGTINGEPVTAIGYQAFYGCEFLTHISISSDVTSISVSAFEGCRGLTGMTIPSGVVTIGNRAFYGCTGLTGVAIPQTVISIGVDAFYSCYSMTSVTIPSGVTKIGSSAFDGCKNLVSATFIGRAPTVGTAVFDNTSFYFTVYYTFNKPGFTSPKWQGYPALTVSSGPEIDIQQPLGTSLVDDKTKKSFGTVMVGKSGNPVTFTIKNTGLADLDGLSLTEDGVNADNFIVPNLNGLTLTPGSSATFKITFRPTPTGYTTRNAAIHIRSNDPNENPFDILLTGAGAK